MTEAEFISEELESFAGYLEEQLKEKVSGRNITASETLLRSIATEAALNELKLYFAQHGRFHDMGAGRGYEKGKFLGVEERAATLKGRKPSKFYSRAVWGTVYGTLVNNLANKFVRDTPALLKQSFDRA